MFYVIPQVFKNLGAGTVGVFSGIQWYYVFNFNALPIQYISKSWR